MFGSSTNDLGCSYGRDGMHAWGADGAVIQALDRAWHAARNRVLLVVWCVVWWLDAAGVVQDLRVLYFGHCCLAGRGCWNSDGSSSKGS